MQRLLLPLLLILPLFLMGCSTTQNADDPKTFTHLRLYGSKIGQGQYAVDINAAGDIEVVLELGPNNVQRGTGHIPPEKMAALQDLLKGWKTLNSGNQGDWSTLSQITYDGHTVYVHDAQSAPAQFLKVNVEIDNLARQVLNAATQTAPATQP